MIPGGVYLLTSADIDNFLGKVRYAIDNDNFDILDSRSKYRRTIAMLGLIERDVLDDIYNLTNKDNWFEPELDNNPNYPGTVWQCKKVLHKSLIYIKLKLKIRENGKLLIMSYHFDNM